MLDIKLYGWAVDGWKSEWCFNTERSGAQEVFQVGRQICFRNDLSIDEFSLRGKFLFNGFSRLRITYGLGIGIGLNKFPHMQW